MKNTKYFFISGLTVACTLFLFFVFSLFCVATVVNAATQVDGVGGNKEEIDELNDKIAEQKDKIAELEETMSGYKKQIEQKQLEAVSLKNQMSILDDRVAKTETGIQLTQERIDEAELEIEALELSIADKETVIEKQKIILAKMVRDIHANDEKNYLEVMMTSDNFADFYSQLQYLESVYSDLGQSAKNLRLAKEDLDYKKSQVESRKETYEELKTELDNKKIDLEEQTDTKETLLSKTKSSEATYQTMLTTLRSQYQAIENEISAYEEQVRKKLAELDAEGNLDSASVLSWPVTSHYITCIFHDPEYPYKSVFEHSGVDIRASQGTPVKAAAAGYVATAKYCSVSSCYSYILIAHSGNISTLYGHMSSVLVSADEFVARGDVIGYSGGTPGTVGAGPFVTGPHLHFEVRLNGIPVDPMGYLSG